MFPTHVGVNRIFLLRIRQTVMFPTHVGVNRHGPFTLEKHAAFLCKNHNDLSLANWIDVKIRVTGRLCANFKSERKNIMARSLSE